MYDITNYKSFQNVENWLSELKQKGPNGLVILLVGNKSDLAEQHRKVNVQEVTEYVATNNIEHLETSALDSSNVEHAFGIVVDCK